MAPADKPIAPSHCLLDVNPYHLLHTLLGPRHHFDQGWPVYHHLVGYHCDTAILYSLFCLRSIIVPLTLYVICSPFHHHLSVSVFT